MNLRNVACLLMVLLLIPELGIAATQTLRHVLDNPVGVSGDYFGISAALANGLGIVGATANDRAGGNSGSAYIFDTLTGELIYTLTNPTPANGDLYGAAVGLSDQYAVVSAFRDDTDVGNGGKAYVYDLSTGALVRELSNPNPEGSDQFGISISVSGSMALLGSHRDNTGASSAGSAYLFDLTTGALVREMNNPTPLVGDQFGFSVSLSGNTAVIGANRSDFVADPDNVIRNVGSAFVFDVSTGVLLNTLINPTPVRTDQFGESVATNGTVALVGTPLDDTGSANAGEVYVFDVATGALLRTIANPNPGGNDQFGKTVAIAGNTALVGAYRDDGAANNSGAAYLFDVTTGSLLQTLDNPSPNTNDRFSLALAFDLDGTILIGASHDDTSARDAGAAYIYSDRVEIFPAAVVLPASAPLFIFALLSMLALTRRASTRRKALITAAAPKLTDIRWHP